MANVRLRVDHPVMSGTAILQAFLDALADSPEIGDAFRAIQRGEADAMLAGGTDALIHPVVVAGFCALRALSRHNEEPELMRNWLESVLLTGWPGVSGGCLYEANQVRLRYLSALFPVPTRFAERLL